MPRLDTTMTLSEIWSNGLYLPNSQMALGERIFQQQKKLPTHYKLLWVWSQKSGKIEPEVMRKGIRWLQEHSEGPYQPLWIGKCLYAPNLVIQSAILSAIQLAKEI